MSEPDWDFWLRMPRVQVWQACALSVNTDPDKMERASWMSASIDGPHFFPRSLSSKSKQDAYEKRVRLTCANLRTAGHFRLDHPVPNPKGCEIYLSDFAKWGVNVMHWNDVPTELIRIVHAASAAGETEVARSVPTAEGPSPHIVTTIKRTRSSILDGVIQIARCQAADANSCQLVWAELVSMAESKDRRAPLLGYVDGEGVKYQDESGIRFLTKDALQGRLSRRAK